MSPTALLNVNAQPNGTNISTVSEPIWNAIRNGTKISDLIKTAPEEVIEFLRTRAVKRLGSFKVKDTDVLLAFGDQIMLTRGLDVAEDPEYRRNWKEVIRSCVEKSNKRRRKLLRDNPWEDGVAVTAYVVDIEDAASGFENGLLSPLVQKSQIGVTSNDIFDLPVVRAVIEYKWRDWARRYLIIEFGLYLGWLFSFVTFLIIYIEADLKESFADKTTHGRFVEVIAYTMDSLSIVCMSPFLFIEYRTILSYGMEWFRTWNLIDSIAYVLQFAISYCHLIDNEYMENTRCDTLLAVQCGLLFIKVKYFGRIFGALTSFVEVLARIISKLYWFCVFIILTLISVALSFAVLYKEDVAKDGEDTADDFKNVIRSVVTTYAILLGNFEFDYVFDGSNRVVKGIFFLSFQVMSSTVLNLLIAVMTEAYRTVTTESRTMYNIGRAQIMDELEVTLPKSWGPNLKPFCHFLVVEQTPEQQRTSSSQSPLSRVLSRSDPSLSTEMVIAPLLAKIENLETEVKSLTQNIDIVALQLNTLVERLPPASSSAV